MIGQAFEGKSDKGELTQDCNMMPESDLIEGNYGITMDIWL